MGRTSSIKRLPPEVRAYLDAELASDSKTLDELISALRAKFPDQSGELPSRSAIHRYGTKLERRLSAIRASTEAAKIIQAQTGDETDARSEALTSLVQSELFEAILNLQDADEVDEDGKPRDPADRIELLSSAAKNIATLTRSSVALKQYQQQVRARIKAAAETVDKIAKTGGLSGDAAEQIRREILGIAA